MPQGGRGWFIWDRNHTAGDSTLLYAFCLVCSLFIFVLELSLLWLSLSCDCTLYSSFFVFVCIFFKILLLVCELTFLNAKHFSFPLS